MDILTDALTLQPTLSRWRQTLHACPEVGFDLPKTKAFLLQELTALGYAPKEVGRGSIVAEVGKRTAETVLLRADVDALAISEEADVSFRSRNGKMHACGHDLHAAILLGAAKLLKEREGAFSRGVRLLFQPAEELLQGAQDACDAGVCDGVSEAYMLHVTVNTGLDVGTVVVPPWGEIAPAADFFEISVGGKGCHGAEPSKGIDPLCVAARILLGLQNLPARECSAEGRAAVSAGSLLGGDSCNVIPDSAVLRGSLRCFGEDLRAFLKRRVEEIAHLTAEAFRAEAKTAFPAGCPSLMNDEALRNRLPKVLEETLGKEKVLSVEFSSGTAGSEDFAVISRKVPSVMLALAAGDPKVALHHPKVVFDESAMPYGVAALTAAVLK